MLKLCNNHVILVNAETSIRHSRLSEFRKIDPVIAENRIKHMKNNDEKEIEINNQIVQDGFGHIIKYNNSKTDMNDISQLYEKLKQDLLSFKS